MNIRNGERPKRSSGELYDSIWAVELPPIMDERDSRAAAVAPAVARIVLLAMASFTNPNRDQVLGPAKTWQCFAAVATIAERADVSERQVQRVLRTLEREGFIELIYQARRPGRPRKNQQPGQGRPNTWSLRPDRWPTRALKNRTGVVAISSEEPEIRPVPAEVVTTPANFSGNSTGTGREGREKPTGVVTRTRSTYEPLEDENSMNKPARADARADETSGVGPMHAATPKIDDHRVSGFQMALPGQAAVSLSEQKQRPMVAPAPADALAEGQRIWGAARQELFRGGQDRALEQRLRNTGTASYDSTAGVLTLDGDLVAEDLEPGSYVPIAVAAAAGRELKVQLVGGTAKRHVPRATVRPSDDLERAEVASVNIGQIGQADEAADRREPFEQSLSAEDRKRKRVASAEPADAPVAVDQVEKADMEQLRPGGADAEIAKQGDVGESPRRRRKKEPAVA